MTFAQSVYLIFTSVYVCKETVEHLLLSSGEGHHHHHGDETASVYGCVLQLRATCGDIHDNGTVSSFLFVCYLSPSFRSSPPLSCSTTTPNSSAVSLHRRSMCTRRACTHATPIPSCGQPHPLISIPAPITHSIPRICPRIPFCSHQPTHQSIRTCSRLLHPLCPIHRNVTTSVSLITVSCRKRRD